MISGDDLVRLEAAAQEKLAGTGLSLVRGGTGLFLTDGTLTLLPSFEDSLPRLRQANIQQEFLVKAAKIKGADHPAVLDATAGLGQDSLLLAASGFRAELYEKNPVIAILLNDAMIRAAGQSGKYPALAEAVQRMNLHFEDSIDAMNRIAGLPPSYRIPDVILLDPMFPERRKSALVRKKFQLLHSLEEPCSDEDALLNAALRVKPHKIVIKRPLKGPFLAGVRPDYSLTGKAVRFDCILPAGRKDLQEKPSGPPPA